MEEDPFEFDLDAPLSEVFHFQKKRKLQPRPKHKKVAVGVDGGVKSQAPAASVPKEVAGEDHPKIRVSLFDHSVENHLHSVQTISKICGEPEALDYDQPQIQRLSSSITFLKEWRHFNYKPRTIRFACQEEGKNGKDVISEISLPQFSAAVVPKEVQNGKTYSRGQGSVWALDWCPRVHQQSGCDIKMEFVAVAAHPPESSYHKIGATLTGRGIIQIWCILNTGFEENHSSEVLKKQKKISGEVQTDKPNSAAPKTPRGRPRKKPLNKVSDNVNGDSQSVEPLAFQRPEDSSSLVPVDVDSKDSCEQVAPTDSEDLPSQVKKKHKRNSGAGPTESIKPQRPRGRPRKKALGEPVVDVDNFSCGTQALAIKDTEDTTSFVSVHAASTDDHENASPMDPSTVLEVSKQRVAGDKLLLKHNRLSDKVSTKDKNHNSVSHLLTGGGNQESPPENPLASAGSQRLKGRPTKKPADESLNIEYSSNQRMQALEFENSEHASLIPFEGEPSEHVSVTDTGNNSEISQGLADSKLLRISSKHKRLKDKTRTRNGDRGHGLALVVRDESIASASLSSENVSSYDPGSLRSRRNMNSVSHDNIDSLRNFTSMDDTSLPRMMLCLAHNGKVAWDVKWRPSNAHDKHIMGYLAVVLGNGALEVWEVPFPHTVAVIYSSSQKEGTDPRFIKLEPVFRCSKLKCGDRQSIPLTVEWSASSPHDMILAGCHDGVVAVWKFTATSPCKETRPLLSFRADTVPIRALAWAPAESNSEGANVIVTAGHKGLKFWDIRDPFRPLWDFNPVQRVILSLDWLSDPRCVIVSFDDGTLRILSLKKAAYDVPVTGKAFAGTQQQGFPSYFCSSFAIWNVHVSKQTGMVAYCGADGNALCFQLTARAVERDPLRNRAPHYLCGSLTEEESGLTVISPQYGTPFPMKKSLNEWGDAPRTKRGFLSVSNQKKRAKEEMAKISMLDEQPLALCYGNDPGAEYDADPFLAQKSRQGHKPKSATKRNSRNDEKAIILRNEEPETLKNELDEESEVVDEIESFPAKSIALHRVRWNMNRGSERWLCYGGAAGIVRCQETDISIA